MDASCHLIIVDRRPVIDGKCSLPVQRFMTFKFKKRSTGGKKRKEEREWVELINNVEEKEKAEEEMLISCLFCAFVICRLFVTKIALQPVFTACKILFTRHEQNWDTHAMRGRRGGLLVDVAWLFVFGVLY